MKKTILIVDDERDVLSVLKLRLQSSGYRILVAESAEEALDILKKNTPDLIFMDLLLPKMQGVEVCKRLKSDDKFRHIPIILFTASTMDVAEKVKEAHADDYLLKPFEPEALLSKIRKFIG
ncbi:MAG: response regulator [Candidatus Aureabacteria bacterium]|nr:response regulator [Candidatus Auribacterota bacterium]